MLRRYSLVLTVSRALLATSAILYGLSFFSARMVEQALSLIVMAVAYVFILASYYMFAWVVDRVVDMFLGLVDSSCLVGVDGYGADQPPELHRRLEEDR